MLAGNQTNLGELLRDNPAGISFYLTEIFRENDIVIAREALRVVMRSQNVQILARDAGMRRDALYRTFGGRIDPQLTRVLKLFDAMDVEAGIMPITRDQEAVAVELCEALNDPVHAVRRLSRVVKARNVTVLAADLGIMRTTVYKTFGGTVDPRLGRVLNLFAALQVRLTVQPRPPKSRAPRPKLGRPPKPT